MHPPPFHRSLRFWLGLTGLASLLWCWIAFHDDPIALSAISSSGPTIAFAGGGTFGVMQITSGPRTFTAPLQLRTGKGIVLPVPDSPIFPPAIHGKWNERIDPATITGFSVAIWFLILLYSAAWLLLLWNARRKARLLSSSVPPE